MKDITSHEDIVRLVDTFYEKVKKDPLIGHFFLKVVDIDWKEHMPIMYRFWGTMLLDTLSYQSNVMTKHISLNQKSPMTEAHFDRWLTLWHQTVDELFAGEKADQAKERATMTGRLMQHKVEQQGNRFFIQ